MGYYTSLVTKLFTKRPAGIARARHTHTTECVCLYTHFGNNGKNATVAFLPLLPNVWEQRKAVQSDGGLKLSRPNTHNSDGSFTGTDKMDRLQPA